MDGIVLTLSDRAYVCAITYTSGPHHTHTHTHTHSLSLSLIFLPFIKRSISLNLSCLFCTHSPSPQPIFFPPSILPLKTILLDAVDHHRKVGSRALQCWGKYRLNWRRLKEDNINYLYCSRTWYREEKEVEDRREDIGAYSSHMCLQHYSIYYIYTSK